MPIRELSPEVISQIAAGEVVTRAGDVVKELVENAVDAVLMRYASPSGGPPPDTARQAHPIGTVSIEILDGGLGRILVADDGCGIGPEDLGVALRRHATSKISSADDLQAIASLGFRGEALAAISAVSDVTIASATLGGDVGSSIRTRDGQPGAVEPHARRTGTTVTVERLFEWVPARRKYQRAASTETAYIGQLLQGYALSFPEIAFSLVCDGRVVLRTPGSADLREAAAAIFGSEAGRELLAIRDERDADDSTVPLVSVTGLIGPPWLHRATRNGIFLAVNRRPVDSRALSYAFEESYLTQMPVGRHPLGVLDITVPSSEVDANVHPTKREVRLLRDRLAFGVMQRAIRATLVDTIGIPRIGETRGQLADVPAVPFEGGAPLFDESRGSPEADGEIGRPKLSALRILGQVSLTYIICEGRAGLYLVDQHAAHERVLLERLEHDVRHGGRTQLLLEPVCVDLPLALRGALEEYVGALQSLGFTAEPFGEGEVLVRSIPVALRSREIERVLRETHETLDAEGAGTDWRERLAVLMSCKTAVKAGQRLEVAEMQSLLEQLEETNLCATCSHGRPTAILLSHSQLEREFGRR